MATDEVRDERAIQTSASTEIMKDCVFVTGGAGFIGSATVRFILANTDWSVVNIDKLTYAGHLETCREFESHPRYTFHRVDIAARGEIERGVAEREFAALVAEFLDDRRVEMHGHLGGNEFHDIRTADIDAGAFGFCGCLAHLPGDIIAKHTGHQLIYSVSYKES